VLDTSPYPQKYATARGNAGPHSGRGHGGRSSRRIHRPRNHAGTWAPFREILYRPPASATAIRCFKTGPLLRLLSIGNVIHDNGARPSRAEQCDAADTEKFEFVDCRVRFRGRRCTSRHPVCARTNDRRTGRTAVGAAASSARDRPGAAAWRPNSRVLRTLSGRSDSLPAGPNLSDTP
jgi:hypothetical protein